MKKSKLLQKTITKLVDSSFKDGKINESQVVKSIKMLKSLANYEAIWSLTEYLKELKRMQRQHTMYIETVIPLSAAQVDRAKKIVGKKFKVTKVLTLLNAEILGGFKLRVGDNVWDESIMGKLDQIKGAIRN